MIDWLIYSKIFLILLFYLSLFGSIFAYDAYVRRSGEAGVAGSLKLGDIPRSLRWMPVVAALCGFYLLAYSFIFIFHPDIQNYYFPVRSLQDVRIAIFGMLMLLSGLVVILVSQYQLGSSYRLNLPAGETRLVTRGLYAVSRNPLYMGLYTAFFGIFLMIPNWIFLFCLLFFIINYHFKITTVEEPYLLQRFGDSFRQYCQKVNRYF